MSFQRATVLYPDNPVTVDTGGTIDVRGLIETYTSDATVTSVQNATQASSAERTFDPANANDTNVNNAATTNSKRGWAIPGGSLVVTDSTFCFPLIVPQTIAVAMTVDFTGTGTGGVGAVDVLTPRASLWKYNPSTDVATLIAGASAGTQSTSALVAYGPTTFTVTVNIVIAANTGIAVTDVLMLVMGGSLAAGAGLAGGARTFTVRLRHNVNTTKMTLASPLVQSCFINTTPIGEGVVSRGSNLVAMSRSAIGEGVVSRGILDTLMSKLVIGEGVVTSAKATIASKSLDVVGEGVVSRGILDILSSQSVIAEGVVSLIKSVIASKITSLIGEGVVNYSRLVVAAKNVNVIGEGVLSLIKATQAVRAFNVIGEGVVDARVELPYDEIPTGGGGGTTTNYIFGVLE